MIAMNATDYRVAIAQLGLSQAAAGRFLKATPRSSRRWADIGAPPLESMILNAMVRLKLKPEDIDPEWKP